MSKTKKPTLGTIVTVSLVAACLSMHTVAATYGAGRLLVPRSYNFHRRPTMDLMSDMLSMPVYLNSLFRQQEAQLKRLATNDSADPSYQIQDLPNGDVELALDVPGIAADDLTVELSENGTLLRVSGTRKSHGSVVMEFDKVFRMDDDVDVDNLTVRLSSGVLKISAPKKEKVVKKLSIVEESEVDAIDAEVVCDEAKDINAPVEEVAEETNGMTITEDDQ